MPVPAECQSSQDEIDPVLREHQSPPSRVMSSPTPAKRMYDPTAPGFAENPWEELTWFRENDPVHRSAFGPTFLFRYGDSQRLLRDRTTSVEMANVQDNPEDRDLWQPAERAMINIDPPKHDRLRGLVVKAFTPARISAQRERMGELIDQILDPIADRSSIDYIDDFAGNIPGTVFTDMFALPGNVSRDIADWVVAISKAIDSIKTEEEIEAAKRAIEDMGGYLREVIAYKKANPSDDALCALIHARVDDDQLTEQEIIDQMSLLFTAGHETTVTLLQNTIHTLFNQRWAIDRWMADPKLAENLIEEVLRWEPPFIVSGRRINLADMQFSGVDVPAGTEILTVAASANRDPSVFGDDADEFKPERENARSHLSFGKGVHHCLGAALSRIETHVAVTRFLERFPEAHYAQQPTWRSRNFLRSLDNMTVDLN